MCSEFTRDGRAWRPGNDGVCWQEQEADGA